jgi:L-lysine 2,3-aminomutase
MSDPARIHTLQIAVLEILFFGGISLVAILAALREILNRLNELEKQERVR